jgi:4-hydroxy-2-oxoheptanedioate aldolase
MGAFGISSTVDYLEQANDSLVTIVQIETKEALENVGFRPAPLLLESS